jgi:hypothetical protein
MSCGVIHRHTLSYRFSPPAGRAHHAPPPPPDPPRVVSFCAGALLSGKSLVTSKNVGLFYVLAIFQDGRRRQICAKTKERKEIITFYLAIKLCKCGIKMIAINSLTHIGSIHTNTRLGSKHIRKNMSILYSRRMCLTLTAPM